MISFKQFLKEAYQDLSDQKFNDVYDREFAHYALNERPIRWNETQRETCRKLYGGIDVGTVYHGGKINTEEAYDLLSKLKPRGYYSF